VAAPPLSSAQRQGKIVRSVLRQQQILQGRAGMALKPPPLVHRDQHRGFLAAPGDHLRTIGEAAVEHLAEPRLGILHLPSRHRNRSITSPETKQTSAA